MIMLNYLKRLLQYIKNKVLLEVKLEEHIKNHLISYYNLEVFNISYLKLENKLQKYFQKIFSKSYKENHKNNLIN